MASLLLDLIVRAKEAEQKMASAYPVAAFLVFAMLGLLVFPVAWLLLAYWQKRRKFLRLSKASLYWSITPILGFVPLYLVGEEMLIQPMASVVIFFLVPVVNVVALAVTMIVTMVKKSD